MVGSCGDCAGGRTRLDIPGLRRLHYGALEQAGSRSHNPGLLGRVRRVRRRVFSPNSKSLQETDRMVPNEETQWSD